MSGRVHYPLVASSDGTLNLIDQRYTLINSLTSWTNAHSLALESNNSLVNINSDFENNIVLLFLRDANAMGLLPVNESNDTVQYSWIKNPDQEDINGSIYIKDQNITVSVELNATEGDWKWTDGTDVGDSTHTKIGLIILNQILQSIRGKTLVQSTLISPIRRIHTGLI